MALEKIIEDDKYEIVTEYKHIQIRTATVIKDDGVEISRTYKRRVLHCGQLDASNNLLETNVAEESAEIQALCNTFWTTTIKDAWKAFLLSQQTLPGS